MSDQFLPFHVPQIDEEEICSVVETLKSGWLTTGVKVKRFEEDFTAYLGGASLQSLAVNSATAGLHLALEALGIRPGDEVITTAILDRLLHSCHVLNIRGRSYRLRDLEDDLNWRS